MLGGEKKLESGLAEGREEEVTRLAESFDTSALQLEKEVVKPTRRNVRVERVALLWK